MLTNPCQPQQPVSVVHVHGLADDFEGTTGTEMINGVKTEVVFPPIAQVIASWYSWMAASGEAQVEKQGVITHTAYAGCKSGTAVELYTIEGGRHAWPSPYAFPTASTQNDLGFLQGPPEAIGERPEGFSNGQNAPWKPSGRYDYRISSGR